MKQKMKTKKNKEQKLFNTMMNHLTGALLLPLLIGLLFKIVVQGLFSVFTTNLAFNKYGSMYTPFDGTVDAICNGFTTICVIIAIPFFIKGIFLMKQYINITKK